MSGKNDAHDEDWKSENLQIVFCFQSPGDGSCKEDEVARDMGTKDPTHMDESCRVAKSGHKGEGLLCLAGKGWSGQSLRTNIRNRLPKVGRRLPCKEGARVL